MPNSRILLSVIMPIFNRKKTLSCAVESVLKVKSNSIEVLLVDDGSTDGSERLCDEYAIKDKRVKVFHKENGGVSSARNVGIDNAQGKYILFCDSDDCVYSEVLDNALTRLSVTDFDLYIFDYIYNIANEKRQIRQSFKMPVESCLNKKNIVEYIISPLVLSSGTGLAPLWHKFFLTETIKKNNIRFEEKIFKGEDWRFVLDFADVAEKAFYISETLYCYNLDGTQTETKYKTVSGYHLLGSPIRKLTLCEKYSLTDSQVIKAFMYKELIDEIVFSAQVCCDRKELLQMKNAEHFRDAWMFFRKMKGKDYNKFEISRRYKLYSYLIRKGMFKLLSLFYKGEKK